jgi:peptidyl-tRNA hydrolase
LHIDLFRNEHVFFFVDTLADSYVLKTAEVSGFAAEMACNRQHSKLVQLFRQIIFMDQFGWLLVRIFYNFTFDTVAVLLMHRQPI